MAKPSKTTPADMRLKANMMPITGTGSSPAFGSPEWRAKYGKTVKGGKKKPATTTTPAAPAAAGGSKSPAFGSPEWRAKYGK